jgi:hypothetical protein
MSTTATLMRVCGFECAKDVLGSSSYVQHHLAILEYRAHEAVQCNQVKVIDLRTQGNNAFNIGAINNVTHRRNRSQPPITSEPNQPSRHSCGMCICSTLSPGHALLNVRHSVRIRISRCKGDVSLRKQPSDIAEIQHRTSDRTDVLTSHNVSSNFDCGPPNPSGQFMLKANQLDTPEINPDYLFTYHLRHSGQSD